jgi:hypothetical protein
MQVIKLDMNYVGLSDVIPPNTDYLYIFDGDNDNGTLIEVMYSTHTTISMMSSQPSVYIEFVSDNDTVHKGFSLTYTSAVIGK